MRRTESSKQRDTYIHAEYPELKACPTGSDRPESRSTGRELSTACARSCADNAEAREARAASNTAAIDEARALMLLGDATLDAGAAAGRGLAGALCSNGAASNTSRTVIVSLLSLKWRGTAKPVIYRSQAHCCSPTSMFVFFAVTCVLSVRFVRRDLQTKTRNG